MPKQIPQVVPPDEDAIADEVIEHDRDLAESVGIARKRARDASERSGAAIATLNEWRWEMTVCEFGPRYSQRVYADAVGQAQQTISKGAAAWQAHLDASESTTGASICSFGGVPHHPREIPPPLTTAQVQSHGKARRRLDAGQIKAIVIERLAAHWDVVPTTIEVNYRALVNEAVARLNAECDPSSMDEAQITEAADTLARQMRLEFQQREAREKVIQAWMKKNLAADDNVPMSEVRKMYDRIERRMASRQWTWEKAEADARDWHWGHCEADRINNELVRKARIAVLDLMQAGARMKHEAIKLAKAMHAIETDNIPLTPDELTLTRNDLADIDMVVKQALATVNGSSGVDWDASMKILMGDQP